MLTLVIFGAADPEADMARQLCAANGIPFAAAARDGRRVHPGNAYEANEILGSLGRPDLLVWFECAPGSPLAGAVADLCDDGMAVAVCDHHRPEDPGYGRPPAEYWEGSSIGQLVLMLGLPDDAYMRLAAAADHCLGAAYRGQCPGINPDDLMAWRAASRATFQRRTIGAVLDDVAAARAALVAAPRNEIGAADFGGATIPELPEAAAREGIAYLATVSERDGRRRKRVLGAATPEQVRAWLAGEGARLAGTYGDPERGFAGGYLR